MLLLRASQTEHGLALRASDPRRLRALFYPLRKIEGLFDLTFRVVDGPDGINVHIEKQPPKSGDSNAD